MYRAERETAKPGESRRVPSSSPSMGPQSSPLGPPERLSGHSAGSRAPTPPRRSRSNSLERYQERMVARTAGVRMLTQSGVATYKFWNTPERLLTFVLLVVRARRGHTPGPHRCDARPPALDDSLDEPADWLVDWAVSRCCVLLARGRADCLRCLCCVFFFRVRTRAMVRITRDSTGRGVSWHRAWSLTSELDLSQKIFDFGRRATELAATEGIS